jgi:ATP-binding cassette subfamily F protein uup
MVESPLISVSELGKVFGTRTLFSDITLAVSEGERIALIGPNGSGKSTLLRMLAGLEEPDSGAVRKRNGLRLAYVPQEDKFDESKSIAETLEAALISFGHEAYDVEGKVEIICGKAGFSDKNLKVSTLSGGWKKRVAIIRGLVTEPDILLLDEPTNHLDIAGIIWLESVLVKAPFALLFVSHDRYFIENLATRVIDINKIYPDGYYSSKGGYADFLEAREAYVEGLHQTRASLANRVRREVQWLRQGAKARTTKSKYRTEEAGKLIDELKNFKLEEKRAELEFSTGNRKTKDLIKIENVSKHLNNKLLFHNISFMLSPGIKLGVVGDNGSGKTTFLKVLLGEIQPDSGTVTKANKLRFAFFDQARKQLDLEMTLKDALCKDGDSVVFNGKSMHVAGLAERFLFSRDHLALRLKALSGGERARVLLAKLMLEETDILFFDEPTNDLDIATLEVLEESFSDYPGAVVLITHDRYFLDRVASTVLGVGEIASGLYADYNQWQTTKDSIRSSTGEKRNKLSPLERKELDNMEKTISKAEKLAEKLQLESTDVRIMADATKLRACCDQLSEQLTLIDKLYSRWQELEKQKK